MVWTSNLPVPPTRWISVRYSTSSSSYSEWKASRPDKLLLTEREGCTGEYWPQVVAVRPERATLSTKTTENQYSAVGLLQGSLVSSWLLIWLWREKLWPVPWKHSIWQNPDDEIKKPIRTLGFTHRFSCRLGSILDPVLRLHYTDSCIQNPFYLFSVKFTWLKFLRLCSNWKFPPVKRFCQCLFRSICCNLSSSPKDFQVTTQICRRILVERYGVTGGFRRLTLLEAFDGIYPP